MDGILLPILQDDDRELLNANISEKEILQSINSLTASLSSVVRPFQENYCPLSQM